MSDNTKKILIMAVCVVCLTMALISSILMPKTQFSVKSILKNIKNDSNVTQNNTVETIKHIDVLPLKSKVAVRWLSNNQARGYYTTRA